MVRVHVFLASCVVVACALAALGVATTAAVPDPLSCAGYPQARTFVETQSWWTTTPGKTGQNFGHVHDGACIPERETLRANTVITRRFILHDNPGLLNYAALVFKGRDYEKTVYTVRPNVRCPPPGTCAVAINFPVDISKFGHSGLQEIRFRSTTLEPDGSQMRTNLNFQVYVQNGKSRSDVVRLAFLRGKGWYSKAGYCEASITSLPIPDQPVSGMWTPRVRIVNHGEKGDLPVTGYTIRLDPDFHNGVPGTILSEGSGQFPAQDVAIDTTALPDGSHKLFARADCDDPRGSTNAGVLIIPFRVANGTVG